MKALSGCFKTRTRFAEGCGASDLRGRPGVCGCLLLAQAGASVDRARLRWSCTPARGETAVKGFGVSDDHLNSDSIYKPPNAHLRWSIWSFPDCIGHDSPHHVNQSYVRDVRPGWGPRRLWQVVKPVRPPRNALAHVWSESNALWVPYTLRGSRPRLGRGTRGV